MSAAERRQERATEKKAGNAFCVSGLFAEKIAGLPRETLRGMLTSFADLKLLPSLEVLYINSKTLFDISAVAELKHLSEIICGIPLTRIFPHSQI